MHANINLNKYINYSRYLRYFGLSASVVLTAIMTLAVAPIMSRASTAEAATPGTASSITMTTTSASARLNLNVTSADGNFVRSSSSETIEFGVKTNNYTGYTLSISSNDNNGYLTNTDTSITTNNKLSSIDNVIDEKTFDNSSYNGKWGYIPSKINSVDNVAFLPSPTTNATTLDVTKSANPTNDNTYSIGLGARADLSLHPGTYAHTFNLAATANPVTYTISYQDNTGDSTVTNIPDSTPSTSTYSTSATTIKLSTVTPSRTGYAFAGWCDIAPTNSGQSCSGNTYAAGSDFGINQTSSNNIVLYALWANNSYGITINTVTGIDSVSLNGTVCTSTCTVNGLEGGKSYVLTAVPSSYYTFSSWSKTNPNSTIADTNASTTTYTVDGATDSITPSVNSDAKGVTVNFSYAGGETAGVDSVVFKESATGVIAGTVSTSGGKVNLNPGVGYTVTVNSTESYGIKSYATTAGTIANTSTNSNTNYFTPNSNNATITVGTCLKTIGSATTNMQGYTESLSNMCDDATGQLKDSRDGQIYTVAKITANSGGTTALWMTRNLAIGCNGSGSTYGGGRTTRSLSSANSNVSTTWSTGSAGALTDGNSYDVARMQCSATYGAWYNYAAATAGTITGSSNSTNADKDICPSGWRLPNHSEISGAASSKDSFSPVAGGSYWSGSLNSPGLGYWWSSDTVGTASRWYLVYNSSYLYTVYDDRRLGYYVRCVKK